jgi:hypothetical protein
MDDGNAVELSPILATQRLDPTDDFDNLSRPDQFVLARFYGERAFTTAILIRDLNDSVVLQCQALSTVGSPSAPDIIKLGSWDDSLEEVAILIEMSEKDHMMHNVPRAMDCVDDGNCMRGGIRLFLDAAPWYHPTQHGHFNQELLRPFGNLHRQIGSGTKGSALVTRVVMFICSILRIDSTHCPPCPADAPAFCKHASRLHFP